ncbi:fibronectin type III domain-containing protein, partial [Clostridium gasigenes]|uniref:fibronectin type III domain-containing protein n=1 Tax=Clostridium gasigenes TaxID=94869 RepID=UPI001C0C834D
MKNIIKRISLFLLCAIAMNYFDIPINGYIKADASIISSDSQQQVIKTNELGKVKDSVRCDSVKSNSVTFSWDKPNNVSETVRYEIYLGNRKLGITEGVTTYTVSKLTAGSSYKFSVKAKGKNNELLQNYYLKVTTPLEENHGGSDDNTGNISKPETLVVIENQDFTKDIGGKIIVSGYFLSNDDSQLNSKILIDNVDKTSEVWNFIVGSERKDVEKINPTYKNALNSGLSFEIDTYQLSNGKHTFKIMIHDTPKEFIINVNNIDRQIIIENLDSNSIQQGIINCKGYIVSSYDPSTFGTLSGYTSGGCDIFIDGKEYIDGVNSLVETNIQRDDLKQKYPDYKYADKSGFKFAIDSLQLSDGIHTIKVKIETCEKEFKVNVRNKYKDIFIQGMDSVSVKKGILKGEGYVLSGYDPTGFNNGSEFGGGNCDVYIDGVGQTEFMGPKVLDLQIARNDVKSKYPDYIYADKCGFKFSIDTYKFTDGIHKLKIKFRSIEKEITINIQNKYRDISIDGFDSNNNKEGESSFTGYILSGYDPSELKVGDELGGGNCNIYIDGVGQSELMGSNILDLQISRSDVKNKYPDYNYADKCGFKFTIDTYKVTNGIHKLKVRFRSIEKEFTINIQNKYKDIIVDGLDSNQIKSGIINYTGYLLSSYDPESLKDGIFGDYDVSIDGNQQSGEGWFSSALDIKQARKDVGKIYSDYKYADKCGFTCAIDTNKFTNGTHKLKIRFKAIEREFSINIQNKYKDIIVDGLGSNQIKSGIINYTGYLLSSYDPQSLKDGMFGDYSVSIDDNQQSGEAMFSSALDIKQPRKDVGKIYSDYKYADKCGFTCAIDTNKFTNGTHKLKIRFKNIEKEFTINIQNKYKDIIVDGLGSNQIKSGIINYTGYLLSSYD